ncbi:hypothetical protein BESB_067770 [Besnoitia besnoiti]|uniref:Guanylylate cyclase n=1 Tax=Besnoitia besnoiti TaxID=94643 RepID=A0A2A9MBZ7_BESBE|nr:hypothetical protein BESB_067770 [Besnoitia besnoiti]PFH34744.1 hypothetical protein BESB_067770 [Besnoitia besnoiti]
MLTSRRDERLRSIKWIGQQGENDCGLTCAKMVLAMIRRLRTASGASPSPRDGGRGGQPPPISAPQPQSAAPSRQEAEIRRPRRAEAGISCVPGERPEEAGPPLELSAGAEDTNKDACTLPAPTSLEPPGGGLWADWLASTQQAWVAFWRRGESALRRQAGEGALPKKRSRDGVKAAGASAADVGVVQRREETVRLWQRLANGAWTVDLFLLFLHLGLGRACFLTTVCEGFNASHLQRRFYAEAEADEPQRVERQFARVKAAGGVVLNRRVSREELRAFLLTDGVVICLLHRGVLDAYLTAVRRAAPSASGAALRARARKAAAEAAASLEYEGHFVVLVGARKVSHERFLRLVCMDNTRLFYSSTATGGSSLSMPLGSEGVRSFAPSSRAASCEPNAASERLDASQKACAEASPAQPAFSGNPTTSVAAAARRMQARGEPWGAPRAKNACRPRKVANGVLELEASGPSEQGEDANGEKATRSSAAHLEGEGEEGAGADAFRGRTGAANQEEGDEVGGKRPRASKEPRCFWTCLLIDPAEPGTKEVDEEVLTLSRTAPGTDEDLLFVSTKGSIDLAAFASGPPEL